MVYNVLIIGAGSIGALKPNEFDSPTTDNILTHAHAVKAHPQFNLMGIMDTDLQKMMEASNKWDCMGINNFFADVIKKPNKIDVVVIATPTETHFEIYNRINNWNLKAIIIEKPCTNDMLQCKTMITDKRIIVNYTRRFYLIIKT